MQKNLVYLLTLLALPIAAYGQGMVSPTAQAEAPVWLEIKVTKVDVTETDEGEKDLTATAEVLSAFKAPESVKAGDTITIQYHYSPKPVYGPDGKRPLGPSSPPLLRQGRQTYAFLEATDSEGVFAPGASAWSFAPPFGIPQEERDKLGMKAPMPPSTPPPPPPSFRVPMKGPTAPAVTAPASTPPPPPPATEQQKEEGTQESQ